MNFHFDKLRASFGRLALKTAEKSPSLAFLASDVVMTACGLSSGDWALAGAGLSHVTGQFVPVRQVGAQVSYALGTYPTRSAALMWVPGEVMMAASGFAPQGSLWMTAAGLAGLVGEVVLVTYGDPKAKPGEEGRIDHQDADVPAWKRGFMPREYPSETAVNFLYLQNALIGLSSYSTMKPYQIMMTIGMACSLALWQVRQVEPDEPKLVEKWNKLARPVARMADWVRERPARAAAWLFILGTNLPMVVGGALSRPVVWPMIGSGLWFGLSNIVMMRISKRQETLKEAPPTP